MENMLNKKVTFKQLFEGDKKTYAEGGIIEKIKTYQDAVKATGIKVKFSPTDTKDEIAYKKLKVVAKALNQGWVPSWDNGNEYKYYPYFDMRSGFGFSHSGYGVWHARTGVGSRLCYKTRELAEYAGKQFESIYKDFLKI